jgi:hypothetical protein
MFRDRGATVEMFRDRGAALGKGHNKESVAERMAILQFMGLSAASGSCGPLEQSDGPRIVLPSIPALPMRLFRLFASRAK